MKLPLSLPDSDSISYIEPMRVISLIQFFEKRKWSLFARKKECLFYTPQQFVLSDRFFFYIFLVLGGKEMVSGLNKFISSLNETSNVEKFCLSPWDECMFQPHIKLH